MKKFAYIDKGGILHISAKRDTAVQYKAKGILVETEMEANKGYPVVNGEEVIVYSPEQMKLEALGDDIEVIPELAALYKQCLN